MLVIKETAFKAASRIIAIAVFLVFIFYGGDALAQDFGLNEAGNIGGGAFGSADIRDVIVNIVNIALGFLGIVAVIIILYGGYLWMTSEGNAEQVDRAKQTLRNGIIGLAIILAAYAIAFFFFREFLGIGRGPEGGGPGDTVGSGALGGGIIESVYPPPGARGIPRTTFIFVTFKELMNPDSIIDAGAVFPVLMKGSDDKPVVEIFNNTTGKYLEVNDVQVTPSGGDPAIGYRIFVFDPVPLLGSPNESTSYTVKLKGEIEKANGDPAFSSLSASGVGFEWSFTVSNLIDITPPTVISWRPLHNTTQPRNVMVAAVFSEAINPISIETSSGRSIVVTNESSGGAVISGNLFLAGDYRTVEFLPDTECEGKPLNTCGEPIFCLPAESEIKTLVKADTLGPIGAFDGITDASGNSLDGNRNGIALGPGGEPVGLSGLSDFDFGNPSGGGGDSAFWKFNTNNTIDITPPLILERNPDSRDTIGIFEILSIKFNKHLSAATLRPDSGYGNGKEYVTLIDPKRNVGYWISGSNGNGCSSSCLNEGAGSAFGSVCGDRNETKGEDCDDGNAVSGDGCSASCLNEGTGVCGDGLVTHSETCDIEADPWKGGGGCDSNTCTLLGTSQCLSVVGTLCCGNGTIDPGEACDDTDNPGCNPSCLFEGNGDPVTCGDGRAGGNLGEECDDANRIPGDGCSASCLREGASCGDGSLDIGEGCDSPNTPGCSAFCTLTGAQNPVFCGDNNIDESNGEACDEGPLLNESFAFINHTPLQTETDYGVRIGSGVRDSFQNCYLPCAGGNECERVESVASSIGWAAGSPWGIPNEPSNFPSCFLP